jgi:hypothetical protein
MKNSPAMFLTPEMAQTIMEVHEIEEVLVDEEEFELLSKQNPDLLNAYVMLRAIALSA